MDIGNSGVRCVPRSVGSNGGGTTSSQRIGANGEGSAPKEEHLKLPDFDWRAEVKRHPYGMLAAAVGIGYVLGGGLFSRPTARVLLLAARLGAQVAALPALGEDLLGLLGRKPAP